MRVIGTPERILDSVLPHEVTHTVMATHFGQPLPRWADVGICTTVEHAAEPKELVVFEGAGHNNLNQYPTDEIAQDFIASLQ